MPINVLSWNIRNLGSSKARLGPGPGGREIADVIVQVIGLAGADIVGIMEIQSGIGSSLLPLLVNRLNNLRPPAPAFEWRGEWSARQDSGTEEEYLYLWKHQPGVLTLNDNGRPSAISTLGVVDRQALARFQAYASLDDAQMDQLIAALVDSKYVYRTGSRTENDVRPRTTRVVARKWGELDAAGPAAAVVFAPPPARPPPTLTQAQCQELARVLLDIDILRFLRPGDRSPYLANFLVGNPAKPLLVALYHTLGPGDRDRFSAINVCAMSRVLAAAAAAGNLLLMGDFNVAAREMGKPCLVYTRTNDGVNWFLPARPARTEPVFGPIMGPPLEAADLLGAAPTTVREEYWPATEPYEELVLNEYDKFFLHSAAAPNDLQVPPPQAGRPPGARVFEVLPMLSRGTAVFDANLALSALTCYRAVAGAGKVARDRARVAVMEAGFQATLAYWTARVAEMGAPAAAPVLGKRKLDASEQLARAQTDVNDITAELADMDAFAQVIADRTATAVNGSGPALNVYRDAVSDHLPILLTLA